MKLRVSMIGAGNMAEALLKGWLKNGHLKGEQLTITNRSNDDRLKELKNTYGIKTTRNTDELLAPGTLVILGCKPKDWRVAIKPFKPYFTNNTPIVSVMAGVTTRSIEEELVTEIPVIRSMPNTSASVAASMTTLCYGQHVPYQIREEVRTLFQYIGETAEVPEDQMDAMTALVGTGPAYIYYLMESMEMAAIKMGIEPELAKILVSQTLLGASQRVQQSDEHPKDLYQQIMSPGGTTEAGFNVLSEHNVQDALLSCILAAWEKSKELGSQNIYTK
ncbi:pyrroline-5-carboxylate reductase [Evansella tamaricis]|uniref:Pyrroline-5-carboxylate reductase n=1 Tax=Evansella tamaricis TaxID=2069301 RepID=A0ABS6JM40_9BACI|nr:pyrroline-5-carboxylate reductase [Evansella tamaricis]MBU9714732.1 pyrroline-5-carboxylate reductase [Evansella tamaricis]